MRDKDTTERRHKHHSLERFRGEKEEQHTERRRSDKREAGQKSSCRSNSNSSSHAQTLVMKKE